MSEAFSEEDYRRTVNLLEHFYNMVLTDCGTGLMHSAMYGVLGVADQIVVVSSGSIDGARSASATMDWLDAHGHGDLVRNAVAVINCVSRSAGGVDLDRVAAHFAGRCRAVVRDPVRPAPAGGGRGGPGPPGPAHPAGRCWSSRPRSPTRSRREAFHRLVSPCSAAATITGQASDGRRVVAAA